MFAIRCKSLVPKEIIGGEIIGNNRRQMKTYNYQVSPLTSLKQIFEKHRSKYHPLQNLMSLMQLMMQLFIDYNDSLWWEMKTTILGIKIPIKVPQRAYVMHTNHT